MNIRCSRYLLLAFAMIFARKLHENWVPGLRNFAKKFGEARCETLAQGNRWRCRLESVGGGRRRATDMLMLVAVCDRYD